MFINSRHLWFHRSVIMIPKNIRIEHIVKAIQEIDTGREIPTDREPHKYQIVYDGKSYPPKFVISLANKYANGAELAASQFSGGDETNPFLRARGFQIALLSDSIEKAGREQEDEYDYSPAVSQYLRDRFGLANIDRVKRNTLKLPSGSVIHTKKSSDKSRWYGLDTNRP